jgi:hypothetical protein
VSWYTYYRLYLLGAALNTYNPDNYDPATDDEYWSGILSPNADDAEDYSEDEVDIKAEKQ